MQMHADIYGTGKTEHIPAMEADIQEGWRGWWLVFGLQDENHLTSKCCSYCASDV